MQGRVYLGGALSGRDIEAVNKTVSGLLKLLFPNPEMAVSDEDLEWIVRMALEARRRVKEQQKRVLQERVPQHPLQLHPGPGRRRAVCLDAGAAQRRSDRERPAAARPGVGGESGLAGGGPGPLPDRGHVRPGQRREDSQPALPAGVSRERQGRRTEPLHAGEGTRRRSRPARARVLDSDAGDGRGQDGGWAWASGAGGPVRRLARQEHPRRDALSLVR